MPYLPWEHIRRIALILLECSLDGLPVNSCARAAAGAGAISTRLPAVGTTGYFQYRASQALPYPADRPNGPQGRACKITPEAGPRKCRLLPPRTRAVRRQKAPLSP